MDYFFNINKMCQFTSYSNTQQNENKTLKIQEVKEPQSATCVKGK